MKIWNDLRVSNLIAPHPVELKRVNDYVDVLIPMLARMYEKRLKGYRAIGYEVSAEVPDPL